MEKQSFSDVIRREELEKPPGFSYVIHREELEKPPGFSYVIRLLEKPKVSPT